MEIETAIENNGGAMCIYHQMKDFCRNLNWVVGSDGSVHSSHRGSENWAEVEIKTKAIEEQDIPILKENLRKFWEFKPEANESMGVHIHISFNRKTKEKERYFALCSWEFVDKFQKDYLQTFKSMLEQNRQHNNFAHFYNNIRDFKSYTRVQLVNQGKEGRYKSVNFNSYNLYGTIEFRIFPMNTYEKVCEYIDFVVNHAKEFKAETLEINRKARIERKEVEVEVINIDYQKEEQKEFKSKCVSLAE